MGVLIEQTDIADLQARLAQTDNADIQLVYNNLLNGSYNHLSAFTGGGQQGGRGKGQGFGGGGREMARVVRPAAEAGEPSSN